MPGASATKVPNHPRRTSPHGSPTAHVRTSSSTSAPSTSARAQTTASASATSLPTSSADNKDNNSGKPRTPSSPAHLFCAGSHTHLSTPLPPTASTPTHSTTPRRNQPSQTTIGGRTVEMDVNQAAKPAGPRPSKKEAIGSHQTAETTSTAEEWQTKSKAHNVSMTPKVKTLALDDKFYTFRLDHNDPSRILVPVKRPNGAVTPASICARWFEETVFNKDVKAPQADCCDRKHGMQFCKVTLFGNACTDKKCTKSRFHMVLPAPTSSVPVVAATAAATPAAKVLVLPLGDMN